MTKTGPNNGRHVVWAISIFFSFMFFYVLTIANAGPQSPTAPNKSPWIRQCCSDDKNIKKTTHLTLSTFSTFKVSKVKSVQTLQTKKSPFLSLTTFERIKSAQCDFKSEESIQSEKCSENKVPYF